MLLNEFIFLDTILNADNYPLYVCDDFGSHATYLIVGCLRKMQNWSLGSIYEEYCRKSENLPAKKREFIPTINRQFIELFDVELVEIPQSTPSWFEKPIVES